MMWKHALRGILGASVAVALASGIAFAKDKEKGKEAGAPQMDADTQAMMAEMAKYAEPGPEHKVLEPSVGKWKSVSKSWYAPGEPTVSEGTAETQWILGGRFLLHKGVSTMMGQPFEGMEVIGYDRKTKEYNAYWIDNMGTAMYPMPNGKYDEATKTLTFKVNWPNPMGPGSVPYRMTTKFVSNDQHVFTMYGTKEGKEVMEMEITYTRVQ